MQESPPSLTTKMTLHNILFGSFTPPKSTGRITHKLKDEEAEPEKPKKKCPAPVQNQAERNDLSRGIPLSALTGTNKGRDRILEILDDEEWMSWTRAVAGSGLNPTTASRILNELIKARKVVKKVVALKGNVRRWYYKRRTASDIRATVSESLNRDKLVVALLKSGWTTKESIAKKLKMEGTTLNHAMGRIRQQYEVEVKIQITATGRVHYLRIEA